MSLIPLRSPFPITSKEQPKPNVVINKDRGRLNGHEWVDLGLSVLWATSNVGASSPSDYGDYYAWGETKTKSSYTEGNSKTYNVVMPDISGEPKYDATGSGRLRVAITATR